MIRHRKTPVHWPSLASVAAPALVFLTVCTHQRRPLLARPQAARVILAAWSKAAHWKVGRYVIMPDHVHLFCSRSVDGVTDLQKWVQYWKAAVSLGWPWPGEHPIWERDLWDRQLRTAESYSQKWNYVRNNPVRHGLVAASDDWPYQGEMEDLRW